VVKLAEAGTVKWKSAIFAALILLSLPMAARADLELPVDNGVVTSGVGWRVDPFGSGKLVFHRGIDIAVPSGTPVHATRKGRVVLAGDDHRGHGITVIVQHDNGDRTLYGHNSLVRVRTGEQVDIGTVLAYSGSTGRSTGPHVHFEKLPSGRPLLEAVAREETLAPQQAKDSQERKDLEQKLDESVNSILRTIRIMGAVGQGG
jgi:murein DD-endopeptidase MepM/ murein hydrolase activator NlpD